LFLVLTVLVFWFTIRREEAWLLEAFGPPMPPISPARRASVPTSRNGDDNPTLEIRPQFFLTTLRDGLVFLLAVPIFESIDHLQAMGWLVPLVRLP
jgi:hypothetical protein